MASAVAAESEPVAAPEIASGTDTPSPAPTPEDEALSEKHGLVMQIIFKRRELAEKKKKLEDKEKYGSKKNIRVRGEKRIMPT